MFRDGNDLQRTRAREKEAGTCQAHYWLSADPVSRVAHKKQSYALPGFQNSPAYKQSAASTNPRDDTGTLYRQAIHSKRGRPTCVYKDFLL